MAGRRNLAFPIVAASAFIGLLPLSACELVFPDVCPDLDEVCSDLRCDDYKQNRDGCSVCECEEGETEPTVCWDDGDCGEGARCDAVHFCEPAPGCDGEGPCPDACYGRCVATPSTCASDADCPAGQICATFDNARPAAPEEGLVAPPQGVCIDATCGSADMALPTCPPGTEIVFDPAIDPCGPTCVAIDPCRSLLPEQCAATPGCTLVEEPCACGPNEPCDCAFLERCAAVDDCARLTVDECQASPHCILVPAGSGGESSGGSSDPAPGVPCIPEDPTCGGGGGAPPPSDLVCVPRSADGSCLSDFDCPPGEVCELSTVCATGCEITPDGQEKCFDECWTEAGVCVSSAASCFDLDPASCLADPRCEQVNETLPCECDPASPDCGCAVSVSCRPREGACVADSDCLQGQRCEIVESCPACDPSTGSDLNCVAPCFASGRCVDGAPPPDACQADTDCAAGEACVRVTVCETCPSAPPPGEGDIAPPPPCDPICRDESVCAPVERTCLSDTECLAGEQCDFTAIQCITTPCPGLCRPQPPTLCLDDTHCARDQRCATELDLCAQNPDDPTGACWSVCVDAAGAGGLCFDDNGCAAGETCRFHADVCLDDPTSDLPVCSGWCAGACLEAETAAHDPATGACVTFPDSCIPPGWVIGC